MRRDPALTAAITALWISLGVFVLYPFARLLQVTFFADGYFSVTGLTRVFANWYDRSAVFNSLFLALAVSLAGVLLGFIFSFAVTRMSLPRPVKWFLGAIPVLPLISPPFTSSIAITLALGPNGMLFRWLGLPPFSIFGFWGTWLSETLTVFPVAFLTLSAVLAAIDPNLEDASLSLGKSRLGTFFAVTLPLAAPGLANAFLLLFASSLADFATPLVLAGHSYPVLPTQAYLQITGMHDLRSGASLSFILLIPALIVYFLQRYWLGKKSYVTVTGKAGPRSGIRSLGAGPEILVVTVCALISAFVLFLYAIIFLGSLVKVWGVNNTLTFDHYNYVFTRGLKAIEDTFLIACVATPLGAILGTAFGYLTSRMKFPGSQFMEFASMLNYALPGTVVGISYVIAFNTGPIVLTGTMAIIVSAYVFRYDATGIRSTVAALHKLTLPLKKLRYR